MTWHCSENLAHDGTARGWCAKAASMRDLVLDHGRDNLHVVPVAPEAEELDRLAVEHLDRPVAAVRRHPRNERSAQNVLHSSLGAETQVSLHGRDLATVHRWVHTSGPVSRTEAEYAPHAEPTRRPRSRPLHHAERRLPSAWAPSG